MTTTWVACMEKSDVRSLSHMRLEPGVEALTLGERLYVRGTAESNSLPAAIRSFPGVLYTMLPDEQLVRYLEHTPTARLPIGHWTPLDEFIRVELPRAGLDAERPTAVDLRIARSGEPLESNLLLLPASRWLEYCETASTIRLRRLRFAFRPFQGSSSDRPEPHEAEVIVHGEPLPPLRGQQWVERCGIAAPCGWAWSPALDAEVLRDALLLEPGDIALLWPDDAEQAEHNASDESPRFGSIPRCEHIEALEFSPASRSSVRNMQRMLANPGVPEPESGEPS